MQCSPIRHTIAARESLVDKIELQLEVRETAFTVAAQTPIQDLFRLLVENDARTALVCDDVIDALGEGRRCLVLSQWKEHCHRLADRLRIRGASPIVLEGGLGKRARTALLEQIEGSPRDLSFVIVATGQYLGEGFDCSQLGTLFLSFPVSFKGRLVRYTGRLMRADEDFLRLPRQARPSPPRDAHSPTGHGQEPRICPRRISRPDTIEPACGTHTRCMTVTIHLPEVVFASASSGRCAILSEMTAAEFPRNNDDRTVPIALRERVAEITAITDRVCEQHLDNEYARLCRTLTVRLARKRPSPLDRGEPRIWAAGVVYTVGSINFLFDRSETPHLRADELAAHVGAVQSTMANKSARIRSLLGLSWYEPELTRASMLERNPFAWIVTVSGIAFDARTLPEEIQAEARRAGLIPDLDGRRAA
jgi:hypothetical protein